MFFKERAAAYERYQCATAFERKYVAGILCVCAAASGIISMFFKECAAASEKVLTTASEGYLKDVLLKENVQLLFRIMST